MKQMVQPIMEQWLDHKLEESLASIDSFSHLLGLHGLQEYLQSHNAQNIEDWSSHPLDAEGKSLRERIQSAIEVSRSDVFLMNGRITVEAGSSS